MVQLSALSEEQFARFAKLVYSRAGIHLPAEKRSLLSNRLRRRMRALHLDSFDEYYDILAAASTSEEELPHFLNVVTTNETYFFRNTQLWRMFTDRLLPDFIAKHGNKSKRLRIWSAASSSGEEAYTIALILREKLPDFHSWRVEVIGSDISRNMLERASKGIYNAYALSKTDAAIKTKWFTKDGENFRLADEVRKLVKFQFHNLRDAFPQRDFDLVLLRNVLMYFDTPMKKLAVANTAAAVAPGGYLYIGDVDPTRTSAELMGVMKLQPQTPGLYHRPAAPAASAFAKNG
ncbi:MAG: protein-glutamate O-methyltransferase CheR [Phycisphaerae bacterium]|nr:protein-glutamate O-methyltransferase CheR [Phycisphaerae bacterium]